MIQRLSESRGGKRGSARFSQPSTFIFCPWDYCKSSLSTLTSSTLAGRWRTCALRWPRRPRWPTPPRSSPRRRAASCGRGRASRGTEALTPTRSRKTAACCTAPARPSCRSRCPPPSISARLQKKAVGITTRTTEQHPQLFFRHLWESSFGCWQLGSGMRTCSCLNKTLPF